MVQLTLTLKMTTTWVVETSVTVNNSHIHDYTHYVDTNKYDRCQWCNESNTASSVEHSRLKSFFFFLTTQQRILTPTSQMVENHKKMELCGKHPHLQTLVKVGTRRFFALRWRGACIIDPTLWESGEKTAGIVKLCIVVGSLQSMTGRFQRCTSGIVVLHAPKFGALSTYFNLLRQWTRFRITSIVER